MPRGMTNASTVRWKPVDSFTLYERGVNNNQDYFTLTYDARSIDLDDVKTDDFSLVVTGVRFRLVRGHLNIQARFSKFDFVSGQLINPLENSFWKFNDMHEYKRYVCCWLFKLSFSVFLFEFQNKNRYERPGRICLHQCQVNATFRSKSIFAILAYQSSN